MKYPRDTLFSASLRDYMDNVLPELARGNELEQVKSWKLHKSEGFSVRSNCHEYSIEIKRNVFYRVDAYHDEHGNYHESEVEYVTSPSVGDFTDHFHTYFQPYASYEDSVPKSCINISLTSDTPDTLIVYIEVIYHPSFCYPYPPSKYSSDTLSEFRQDMRDEVLSLRRRLNDMELECIQYRNEAILWKKKFKAVRDAAKASIHQYEQHIKKQYIELGQTEECPVCYETMTGATLAIPRCFHYLCISCSTKCTSCPLCRTAFAVEL